MVRSSEQLRRALVAELSKGRLNGKGNDLFEQRVEWVESWNGFVSAAIHDTSTTEAVRHDARTAWWKQQKKQHAALVTEARLRGLTATATVVEVAAADETAFWEMAAVEATEVAESRRERLRRGLRRQNW